jgi:hypothetical protein
VLGNSLGRTAIPWFSPVPTCRFWIGLHPDSIVAFRWDCLLDWSHIPAGGRARR